MIRVMCAISSAFAHSAGLRTSERRQGRRHCAPGAIEAYADKDTVPVVVEVLCAKASSSVSNGDCPLLALLCSFSMADAKSDAPTEPEPLGSSAE